MILYLDTSGLIKLYVEEPLAEFTRDLVSACEIVATSRLALPEMASGLARKNREGDLEDGPFQSLVATIEEEWATLARIEVDERAAARLAIRHGLRGADAVHLDAAVQVCQDGPEREAAFLSFDRRLNRAALAEGLRVLAPQEFL